MKIKRLISLVSVFVLGGCVQMMPPQPDDPYYAPVIPPAQQASAAQQPEQTGSIYNQTYVSYLYSDRKATRIGDLITVTLNERTNASKNADTEIKNSDKSGLEPMVSGRIPSYGGNPISFELDKDKQFKAEADSEQANSLNGTITVTVSQVLPNGNLFIKGEKWLTLNQGNEFIRISGIIRPDDISTDNTIPSTRVANARISYAGTGDLDESNKMGWLSRFFNSSWFPL